MQNAQVVDILNCIASIKKAKNANKFSIGAYLKAAKFVASLSVPISEIDLENTKGIGEKIGSHIKEFLETGKVDFVEENKHLLQSAINAQIKVQELLKIEGIGEKTAIKLHQKFGITTVDQLKKLIETESINTFFKEKSIQRIKKGIDYLEKTRGRIRLDQALDLAKTIFDYLKPHVQGIEFCGSLRRSKETIGDLDVAVIPLISHKQTLREFETMPIVDEIIDGQDKKSSVWINGIRVDCYAFDREIFKSGIMHLTGCDEHNKNLRIIAKAKGMILSQYGLYRRNGDEREGPRLDAGTEESIYKILGLKFIPPEHREGNLEFFKYKLDQPDIQLVNPNDVHYDFHVHSTWSDSSSSIEDNIKYAISIGLKGIAICDHSQSLKIARGMSIETLRERNKEIDRLRAKYNFEIFKSAEVDIKSNGLDYPDEILDELDIVTAAIHTSTKQDVTNLYLSAIESGKVDIIAHITGRLINEREGLQVDIETILKACKEHDVAIELNCQPNRLDANETILQRCNKLGVKVALGSDAHEMHQIKYVKTYGVWISKRAWLNKNSLLKGNS